ncbi:DoxX family membrane protein [Natronolimnobius sp. AArcel1]|uniref:DoxX family membrane protein n=1 Tax=Natronolimnobius sp. AArcel1 TaxID=1679093 RepID=UPI0013EDC055|nr:DoxX family membrane protein [Natronolimnobius sp. AArcel1]NGM68159.1 DoxX family membrane protein [Natronolimnobius sp. AArcel1]
MAASSANRLESRYGGVTLEGEPHALSAWFVVGLRVTMGLAFLGAGLGKLTIFAGEAFDASGYLMGAEGPLAGVFGAMAANPALIDIINVVVPATQILIGVGLLVGGLVRLAALGGAMQMSMFYLASWDVAGPLGFVNSDFVYLVVFLAIGAFGAGRILGADRYIEQLEVGGQALIERYPKLRYLLG